MKKLHKKIYVAAGYYTVSFGSGRKEFNPRKPMPAFETYLAETAKGSKVGAACSSLLEEILGAAQVDPAQSGGKSAAKKGDSLLGKIDFRAMMPSRRKDKAAALED